MTREPESRSFLAKAGFEKKETRPKGWVFYWYKQSYYAVFLTLFLTLLSELRTNGATARASYGKLWSERASTSFSGIPYPSLLRQK